MGWLSRVGSNLLRRNPRYLAKRWQHTPTPERRPGPEVWHPGKRCWGYTCQDVKTVPELDLTAVLLEHDKTGAQHLHIARHDSDNVFGVSFRTTPMDDTGVPHILEHTALCGSDKFPVRDPFFKMLNRSLSTFMNAFTASDWTLYPFSTQNQQDYLNLLSVYLDAAFFPKLQEHDFRQEGWRLEHQDLRDPNSPIVFKGVVYNEMKGAFSNSQQWFAQKAQNLLLPGHTYSVVSGGDPAAIPDLTWQQLRDFHASHYHPSNARFYTYGNFALEPALEFINEHALQKFDKINPGTEVPLENRWDSPRQSSISCSPDPMAPDINKQTTVAVSYLLKDVTDTKEGTVLSILGSLLVEGEKSPFYQSLLESNIGSDYSPVIGFDNHTRESTFSVGLQGIHSDDVNRVQEIIDKTIDKVIEEGFEQERVEAILHRIELSLKHQTAKFGLNLGVSVISSWTHNTDPMETLQVNAHVDYFKQCLEDDPDFLKKKVKQYLKDNPHKLTLVMKPDVGYDAQLKEAEAKKLDMLVSKLSTEDKDRIHKQGVDLVAKQMKEEDLSCLPTVKVSDIDKKLRTVLTDTVYAGNVPIQVSSQPTNGVTYFRAIANTRDLPAELKPYIPLFCNVVTSMGAGIYDYKELSQQIDLYTGGLSASCHVSSHQNLDNTYEEGILFSSFALDKNIPKMYELWTEIFHRLDMSDNNRLVTLIMMNAAELANSLAGAGHTYAMTHAASNLHPGARYKEATGGITQVSLMKSLAEMKDFSPVIQKLKAIADHVLTRNNLRCALNATPNAMGKVKQETEMFLTDLKHIGEERAVDRYTEEPSFSVQPSQTQFELPFQVNYVARSVQTVPFTSPDFAPLRILGRLMTNKFLHREIREKGGAYGGGASGMTAGVFNFYSYRDPNSMATLDAFDAGVDWVKKGEFTQQDIDEAKLSIFSQVDMPVPPGQRGGRLFLTDITDDDMQAHREQLFAVSKDHLIDATDRYLSKEKRVSSVSFLGPQNPNTQDGSWNIKKH